VTSLSSKTDISVLAVRNKQQNLQRKTYFLLLSGKPLKKKTAGNTKIEERAVTVIVVLAWGGGVLFQRQQKKCGHSYLFLSHEFTVPVTNLQPGQHQLFGREVGGSELVVGDQGPDQTQDQLHVPILDISVSWI
jgi:hypothetical protein